MSKYLLQSSNVALASVAVLLFSTAYSRASSHPSASADSKSPITDSDQDDPNALRGLVNQREVPLAPSDTLQVDPGETLPNNGATDVPVDTLLRIGFDNAPVLGSSGTIRIYRRSHHPVVHTLDLHEPSSTYDRPLNTHPPN